MQFIDWTIVALYLIGALAVGYFYARRSGKSTEEYFLSGRSLPWWIAGTSMVATTFAADTPLAITELVRSDGIWRNWWWWNLALGGLLGVFFFARLWRRAKVLTDNELIELRYSGKPASGLRAFKALYFSLLYNFIVMGWVINGMSAVASVTLGVGRGWAVWGCALIALIYSTASGFWGVVITDFFQFILAMGGAILLAVLAVERFGGMGNLLEQVKSTVGFQTDTLSFFPSVSSGGESFLSGNIFTFLIFLSVMWWASHNADGGGYIIQRMSSCKDERHALLATLWFNLCNYAFRVWPWIIVAVVSLVMFPALGDDPLGDKAGYPRVMVEVCGPGVLGILIASFLAAFMSTISTHLNWGASYLLNDVYRRFIHPDATERHYVWISRGATVLVMAGAALTALSMGSIARAWEFIWAMGCGIGPVLILRWFWWRISAWSEIAALASSILVTITLEVIACIQTIKAGAEYALFSSSPVLFGLQLEIQHKALIVVPVSIVTWVTVTMLTRPEPEEKLKQFYQRVRPGGNWPTSWKERWGSVPLRGHVVNWILGAVMIYGATFGIGLLIFGNGFVGMSLLILAVAGGFIAVKRAGFSEASDLSG
ncbi:sodium:proline symporter [candidate division LCP-89 bacterium B3_LCP]|uniref:Sodium:proline symporter n=1 Tax=candidate division LCP-89 bacterium B3_LCP TaxID=2012998 RepID=A0A532V2C5_UNCL8|nr:MAG: sodium:proline symporter [candidate division LCP-89 bacterium B3_LCP]